MAYVQAAALITRLREVLEDSAGTLRTVPAARFDGDSPEGLSADEAMRRSLTAPRIRARVKVLGRSKSSPPITGNLVIYDITVSVKSRRTITPLEQLDEASNDVLMAAAVTDADVIRQALEYPGNLTQTAAAAATDLVSGMLSFSSGDQGEPSRDVNTGAQMLEQTLSFTGWLISRPAIA